MTAWISMIDDADASPALIKVLEMARTPHGTVDNVMRVHSHRPNTMRGHIVLYRAVLHDETNIIPNWFQEVISSYVSILNECTYSLKNHWKNAAYLIDDTERSDAIRKALDDQKPEEAFDGAELSMLQYAEKLTLFPQEIEEKDIIAMRKLGLDDGAILETNQLVCYFNYVNRSLNGLGVTTAGDIVGYYKEDPSTGE